jgi:hypothetical protein
MHTIDKSYLQGLVNNYSKFLSGRSQIACRHSCQAVTSNYVIANRLRIGKLILVSDFRRQRPWRLLMTSLVKGSHTSLAGLAATGLPLAARPSPNAPLWGQSHFIQRRFRDRRIPDTQGKPSSACAAGRMDGAQGTMAQRPCQRQDTRSAQARARRQARVCKKAGTPILSATIFIAATARRYLAVSGFDS